jgi:hypothetical protein
MITIDANEAGPHQAWEWMFDASDLSLPLEDMLGRSPLDLHQRIAALSGSPGAGFDHRPLFLNVAVRPGPHTGPIDIEQLQAIVADPSIGLEGIRLLFMAGDETE